MKSDLIYWLWLSCLPGLTPLTKYMVLSHFEKPERVFSAQASDFLEIPSLTSGARERLCDKSLDLASRALENCSLWDIGVLTLHDPRYPARLKRISDPPCVLYTKGTLFPIDTLPCLAIVGARESSSYGAQLAFLFSRELARRGILIISGMAQGIDTAALEGALRAGGAVVSVLATGIDVVYPPFQHNLHKEISVRGLLLSECPPSTPVYPSSFPVRNRILSGLSLGVLVAEGRERSGSLISARCAIEQGRDVFAFPGNLDNPMSKGPNMLIGSGEAKLIRCAGDIAREVASSHPDLEQEWAGIYPNSGSLYGPSVTEVTEILKNSAVRPKKEVDKGNNKAYIDLTENLNSLPRVQVEILRVLSTHTLQVDDLVSLTKIPAQEVLSALTLMSLDGLVEELEGKRFRSRARLSPSFFSR